MGSLKVGVGIRVEDSQGGKWSWVVIGVRESWGKIRVWLGLRRVEVRIRVG